MKDDLEKWKALFIQKLMNENVPNSELHEMLIAMRDGGLDSNVAYNVLENLRSSMKLTEQQEDSILDLMDIVVGWCSPSARI